MLFIVESYKSVNFKKFHQFKCNFLSPKCPVTLISYITDADKLITVVTDLKTIGDVVDVDNVKKTVYDNFKS